MAFLDETGLTHLWEKVEAKIAASGGGSSSGGSGGGLHKMSAVSGYLGIPVAELPTDGTIWMSISSGNIAELYSGTITIEGGDLVANNLIAVSNGSVIQLNQAVIMSAGFAIYGMPSADYVGVWQQIAIKSGKAASLTDEEFFEAL